MERRYSLVGLSFQSGIWRGIAFGGLSISRTNQGIATRQITTERIEMENRLTTVEKTCANLIDGQDEMKEQLVEVRLSTKEIAVSNEKILTNHLPHIKLAIDGIAHELELKFKILFWVWAFGIALIAILIAIQ